MEKIIKVMRLLKIFCKRIASYLSFFTRGMFKISFPLFLGILIISPIIYYSLLIQFSNIGKFYQSYFYINIADEKPVFVKDRPKTWVSLSQVSSKAVWPIILSEDWAFYYHSGVDWNQLSIVLREGVEDLKIKRGASTITQQVVKNLFLNKEKSILRKFNEILLSFYLENKVTKKWILEQYLNLAEFDKNVFGIKQAAWHYFKKSPSQLTYREGAFLALLLPNPKKYSASFYRKELSFFVKTQIKKILGKLIMAKRIDKNEMMHELASPFYWERGTIEFNENELSGIFSDLESGKKDINSLDEEINNVSALDSKAVDTPADHPVEEQLNEEQSDQPSIDSLDTDKNKNKDSDPEINNQGNIENSAASDAIPAVQESPTPTP